MAGTLAQNQIVKRDTKLILKEFESFSLNLAINLLARLRKPLHRYEMADYYKILTISKNLKLESFFD